MAKPLFRQTAKYPSQLGWVFLWYARQDSNLRPADYESAALPTELHQLINFFVNLFIAALSNNQRPLVVGKGSRAGAGRLHLLRDYSTARIANPEFSMVYCAG